MCRRTNILKEGINYSNIHEFLYECINIKKSRFLRSLKQCYIGEVAADLVVVVVVAAEAVAVAVAAGQGKPIRRSRRRSR